jgi:hypothetical protein
LRCDCPFKLEIPAAARSLTFSLKEPLDNAFALSRPTVLASAAQMLIENRIKSPAQIAEDLVMNADDIESICALPRGTLQKKVVAFKLYM